MTIGQVGQGMNTATAIKIIAISAKQNVILSSRFALLLHDILIELGDVLSFTLTISLSLSIYFFHILYARGPSAVTQTDDAARDFHQALH